MDLLQGLHGLAAVALVCGLLFIDEAGLPLPLAPSELLLIFAGLLVTTGGVTIWVFAPLALLVMTAGLLAGYAWARTLGQDALRTLAEKVHADETYEKACGRMAQANPLQIGVARVVPGVRPYATLVAGASEIPLPRFLLGAFPALVLWEAVWLGIGVLVGAPAMRLLNHVEGSLLQGGLLIVLGATAVFAVHRATDDVEIPSRWVPAHGRLALAFLVDGAMVGCIVAGFLVIGRTVLGLSVAPWIDVVIVVVVIAIYLAVRPDGPRITARGVLLRA
jgi:membrane-associated protein